MLWYIESWLRFADFRGRSLRREYWIFGLFTAIITLLLEIPLLLALLPYLDEPPAELPYAQFLDLLLPVYLFAAISILPNLALTVRRLHDTDRSGFWLLISLVPVIGPLWLLVLCGLIPGSQRANRFGPLPQLNPLNARTTTSLFRREFSAYFLSPIAYVVIAVFLAVLGHRFYLTLEQLTAQGPRGVMYPMQFMIEDRLFWLVFLFIPPLLTMRLFAEERSSGTLEMLLTAPLRDYQIVVAKYAACFAFYVVMWLPTLVYLVILADWEFSWGIVLRYSVAALAVALLLSGLFSLAVSRIGFWVPIGLFAVLVFTILWFVQDGSDFLNPHTWVVKCGIDPWPIVSTYFGLALVGAMFLALGLFISSLVKSQLLAAILSLFVGLLFIVPGMWQPDLDPGSVFARGLSYITVPLHFERNFSRGIIDTRQLVLYGSVALMCLFLTVRSLESRRWR